ncbi:MAG: phosphotransferase enzyme family protein [Verrucomicrobiales bacterium]
MSKSSAFQAQDVRAVARHFAMPGEFLSAQPCGNGHINDTFEVRFSQGGLPVRYIVQRINHHVFKRPDLVMDNIRRVTEHITRKLRSAGEPEPDRKVLSLISCRDGRLWHQDAAGNHWRGYVYIERARAHDHVDNPRLAEEAACAFGRFQHQLTDLPGGRLGDTIPDFHHTRRRFDTLMHAVSEDRCGRASEVETEIDFCREREWMVDVLLDLQAKSQLPERVTHNDTKINNVMIDTESGRGVCIMDLDTVMPGLVLYDFGDLVRTTTISTAEDEVHSENVHMRLPMFEALVKGYLEGAGSFLTETEIENLGFSGNLITLEVALRFLTDYLEGDHYFKIDRPDHNLDRFRVQAALVKSMEAQEAAMRAVVDRWRGALRALV